MSRKSASRRARGEGFTTIGSCHNNAWQKDTALLENKTEICHHPENYEGHINRNNPKIRRWSTEKADSFHKEQHK